MIRDYGREIREDAREERGKEASLVATAVGLLVAKTLWNLTPVLKQLGTDSAKRNEKKDRRSYGERSKDLKINTRGLEKVFENIMGGSGEHALKSLISIDDTFKYKGLHTILNRARWQYKMPLSKMESEEVPEEEALPEIGEIPGDEALPEIGEIPEEKAPEEKAPEVAPEEKAPEVVPEEKSPEKAPETEAAPKVKRKRKPAKPRMKVPEETGPSSDNYFGEFMDRYREKYGLHQ